jgi:thiamine pyrophosphate-dependent acetolactate synthase large subunit-like protein
LLPNGKNTFQERKRGGGESYVKKVSEIIVQELKSAGVRVVFGIPSVHNIGLYDALRREPSIRHILCRHEASATHMADGYARSGKGVGVVIASTGPGVAYTISPLTEAWSSCSPVIIITSNISSDQISQGLGVLHEVNNQDTLFKEITKTAICIREIDTVQGAVERAIHTATSGRPGPVYLEVPVDFWDREVDYAEKDIPPGKTTATPIPDPGGAIRLLKQASLPIIVAGIEAVHTELGDIIGELAEILCAPVLTDFSGKGIIPEDHPLGFGSTVRRGVIREIHKTCDVTLAVGSRLRWVDFYRRGVPMPGLIHIDWDDIWINKNYPAAVELIGDVRGISASLLEQLESDPPAKNHQSLVENFRKKLDREMAELPKGEIEAQYLDALRRVIPRDGTLVVDNTILGYLAEQIYPSFRSGGVVAPKGSTPIGFAFPGAIGLKTADPARPVVALIGDGGFLYGAQELATCIRHGIGFPVIVVNDSAYRMIDYLQLATYPEGHETALANPDFVSFAESFGVSGIRVQSPKELGEALEKALISQDMSLIEVKASFPDPPLLKY